MLRAIERIEARTQLRTEENENMRDWSSKIVRCKECNRRYLVGFSMDFEYCPDHSKTGKKAAVEA